MSTSIPITRSTRQVTLEASAAQTVFTFNAGPVWDTEDLVVQRKIAPATRFTTITTGFTKAQTGSPAGATGATVTFSVAPRPTSGDAAVQIRITARRTHERSTDFSRAGRLHTPSMEREADEVTTVLQELRRDVDAGDAAITALEEADEALAEQIVDVVLGQIPDGSLTPEKFEPAAVETSLYTPGGTGAVPRILRYKLRPWIEPQDYSAATLNTYEVDATDASNKAIDYAKSNGEQVVLTAGAFMIGGSINIEGNGTVLRGRGQKLSTILKSPSAGNDIITFQAGISGVQLEGLDIDRAVAASAGAHGIRVPNAFIDCILRDIRVRHSDVGVLLGPTAFGKVINLWCSENLSHGVLQTNADGAIGSQWYSSDCYMGNNGGWGWLQQPDAAAVGSMAAGEHSDLKTFGNDLGGFAAIGRADAPIAAVRIKGQNFSGQNGGPSYYLDTYGTNHELHGLHAEEDGTIATGPTNSTPATWEAHGLHLTANNGDVHLEGSLINGHAWSGIYSETPRLHVDGVVTKNNGRAEDVGHAYQSGAHIAAGTLIGHISTAGSSDPAQKWGVTFAADNDHHLDGHNLTGNTTAPIAASVALTKLLLSGGSPAEVRCTDVDAPDFILSPVSGNPYPAGTLTNQVTLYITPAGRGRKLPLFNGVNWSSHNASEFAYTINKSAISPSATGVNENHDVFAFYDRATLAPKGSKGFAWASATSRGTGPGTTELELFNGFWVNKYDITNAAAAVTIPARCGLYLGTIRCNVSALIDYNFHNVDVNGSNPANRCAIGIWNQFNRRRLVASLYTSASSWSYSSQTIRQRNGEANDKFCIVSGMAIDDFQTSIDGLMSSADVTVAFRRGAGLDSTTAYYGANGSNLTEAAGGFPRAPVPDGIPAQLGYHEITVLENIQQASKTATGYGGRDDSTCLLAWAA